MAEKIDSIKVERFKAFKDETVFNIGKHNLLIYGENGAGKSSLYDALKVVFFYKRISDAHRVGVTLSGKYDHRGAAGYGITVNNEDYLTFIASEDYADYHVSMISNADIQVGNYISYKELLERVYFHGDLAALLEDEEKTTAIAESVNKDLRECFKEEYVTVAISRENELKCSLKGPWSGDTYIENIRDYFNEAII